MISLLAFTISPSQAQNTLGKEFWLTFGQNSTYASSAVDLQIRIVSGDQTTSGTIFFYGFSGAEATVSFTIPPKQVFNHILTTSQKTAVYNTTQGIYYSSIFVSCNNPVTAYALNQAINTTDATNVLPETALGTEYYQISHIPIDNTNDAYAVIAKENNTQVTHNAEPPIILNKGQVYYRSSSTDMTGARITSNKPSAFFIFCQASQIPNGMAANDCFMQQLAPVNTWGRTFFVPVSDLTTATYYDTKDRVRIMACQDNTTFIISPTNATLITTTGGQTPITKPLQAGEFFEIEITLNNNGTYFKTDKPVGVCTYLTSMNYNNGSFSDPAIAWVPSIEQTTSEAMIAPFIPGGNSALNSHKALIITSTFAKNNTKVSIGGSDPEGLSGGIWRDNVAAGISFYNMPLTNNTESYNFTNKDGLFIMGYGTGMRESYYYLASSSMRDLDAAFYANNIHFQDLSENPLCENEVAFRAEIVGELDPNIERIKWYIDGTEYLPARDQLLWSKPFSIGAYVIKMWCRFENNDTISKTGTLKIKACNYSAAFYANNVHHTNLLDTTLCDKVVNFQAVVTGLHSDPGSLKWYINDPDHLSPLHVDETSWSQTFENGEHHLDIDLEVRYDDGETETISGTFNVRVFWTKIKNIRY
jgi:hypothetical protein